MITHELTSQIFDSMSMGILTLDRDFKVRYWNKWLELNSGISSDTIKGKIVSEFFPEIDSPQFRRNVKSVFKLGNYCHFSQKLYSYMFKFKVLNTIGPSFEHMQQNCTMGPLKGSNGKVELVFLTVQDVTDKVKMELILNEQATFVKNNPAPVLRVNRDGEIVNANPATNQLLGKDTVGMRMSEIFPAYGDLLETMKNGMELNQFESYVHGNAFLFSVREDAVTDSYYVYGSNISDLKAAEESLKKANESLDKRVKEKTRELTKELDERIKAESNLRKWANIFEKAEWGVVVGSGKDQTLELMNPAYARMHGYTVDELTGRKAANLYRPEDRAGLSENLSIAREKGCHTFEAVRMRKDGSTFHSLNTITAIKDADGELMYYAVNVLDITERKRAEEKLGESKSNLAMAQKMARIGSWEYNSVTNKCIWSDETYRLFGFEPQEFEITYKYYLDAILHPEDRERVVEEVNNALEHDDEYEGEYRIITKDGRVLTMHSIAKLYRDSNGNTVRMIGSIQDITERKQVEDELKKSNERFRLALDNSKITVFNQDSELRYTWVYNPAPGLSPDFVVGKTDHDLVPDEDARVLTEMKRRVLETGVLEHGTIRFTIEGVPSYHDLNVEPLRDENERIVGVIGVSTNITDIKHAEKEIQELNEELEERVKSRTAELETANQELESFAYSVSHELRAPLRSIDGFSHAIVNQHSESMDDEALGLFKRVRAASQKMASLIDGLLELSRLSRTEMSIFEVDLSRLARASVEYLRNTEPGRNVSIEIMDGLTAKGDRKLLQTAIQNLINNAWKFTSGVKDALIEFGREDREGRQVFYIRDNGAGFKMDYSDKLFGLFQRLHSVEEFSGTGVGLAAVKRIIARHGGKVWATGEEGKGSTFYFTL
ncbi:MAG TPA: PAS domain S-box protein [Nitrospirae bacterium]|nr:PAS domain S-box protein [Nitrospirota bacterium]